jgi:hypothetical protein
MAYTARPAIMNETSREPVLARVTTARDRLAVLSARTSNPDLLVRIGDADAIAAALQAECQRTSFVTADLRDRVARQSQLVDQLTIDFNRDAIE